MLHIELNNLMAVYSCNYLHVSIIRVIGFYHSTKFHCSTPSCYKNYIGYYDVYHNYFLCSLKSMCIQNFVLIGCCVREIHVHAHLCPYSIWPAVIIVLMQ